ncbi:hypothetical protein D3C74_17250 [compost metagenome]
MLKNLSKLLVACVLMLSFAVPAYANEGETADQRLASLQEVMDEVNAELGSTYYIPEENQEKVINNLEGMSLKEVENYLIEQ